MSFSVKEREGWFRPATVQMGSTSFDAVVGV